MTYYRSTVVEVGAEAIDMIEGGVLILFADPVPEALAEVSVVHRPSHPLSGPVQAGDQITVGDDRLTITAVGEIAAQNLEQLGHIVLYVNQPDQKLLPGAVLADGTLTVPKPDQVIEFRSAS